MRVLFLAVLVLVSACAAQNLQETPDQELDRILGRSLSPVPTLKPEAVKLEDCQSKLKEWQEWGRVNYPIGQKLYAANSKLTADNEDLTTSNRKLERELNDQHLWLFFGFAGVGAGLAVVFLAVRFLWRKWRLSATGKQLGVLVLGALWMTAAVFIALDNPSLSVHPINLAVTVVVYSLPAILFASIAFWWFEKTKEQT